jgi:hypothetical protein
VVNAASGGARGYGYNYAYGYGYTYSYGYKYADYNDADGYHDDPLEHAAPVPRKG